MKINIYYGDGRGRGRSKIFVINPYTTLIQDLVRLYDTFNLMSRKDVYFALDWYNIGDCYQMPTETLQMLVSDFFESRGQGAKNTDTFCHSFVGVTTVPDFYLELLAEQNKSN